jgi:hypothetical protein
MYKRKNSQLVGLYKFLLWFVGFAAILMIFLFASYGETLGYSGAGLFFLFLLVFVIDYSLLKFFQRQVQIELLPARESNTKPSDVTTTTLTNEKIWENVSLELESNRREGLWARCFSQSNGDVNKAKALYLRSRVSEIENELNIKPSSKDYMSSIPLFTEAKEWWENLNFIGKMCVIGLIVVLLASLT